MLLPARYIKKTSFSGGLSAADLCEDTHLSRLVIVKRLLDATDRKRLLDEIRALQSIRSPHVVQIFDVIRDSAGDPEAIVEEFVDGPDLTSMTPPTTAEELMRVLYPIAVGISEIHRHGHVHRDIKRQNMKFDPEGVLKIFDFGFSRVDDGCASTIGQVGTPGYMAPELFVEQPDGTTPFTAAVDVYAFGATAMALAFGSLPAPMRTLPPTPPFAGVDFAALAVGLPHELAEILNSCLSPTAQDRPQMAEVAEVLSRHLLRGKHRAQIGFGSTVHHLDQRRPTADISVSGQGGFRITYDGLKFYLTNLVGSVSVNNTPATDGQSIPGSCAVVLGGEYPSPRTAVTIDVSHPEVMT